MQEGRAPELISLTVFRSFQTNVHHGINSQEEYKQVFEVVKVPVSHFFESPSMSARTRGTWHLVIDDSGSVR